MTTKKRTTLESWSKGKGHKGQGTRVRVIDEEEVTLGSWSGLPENEVIDKRLDSVRNPAQNASNPQQHGEETGLRVLG
jgi:hypothetical protein